MPALGSAAGGPGAAGSVRERGGAEPGPVAAGRRDSRTHRGAPASEQARRRAVGPGEELSCAHQTSARGSQVSLLLCVYVCECARACASAPVCREAAEERGAAGAFPASVAGAPGASAGGGASQTPGFRVGARGAVRAPRPQRDGKLCEWLLGS